MSDYIITTKRLGLRRWIEQDAEPFIEMNQDKEVMQFFPKILSSDETIESLNRINLHFEKNNFGLYAVEKNSSKQFIGFTGFAIPSFKSFFTPCVEIGWRFKKDEWGNGYATEAANACIHYGFGNLGFDKIFSFTSALNIKSENVMKRVGMIKVGEFAHPGIESGHSLCRHVLYRVDNPESLDT